MLTEIRLGNFKSFGKKTAIPLAPITVFIGPNGSGKSAVLHALMLLRQSLSQNNLEYRGREIDLVGFSEVVFRKDISRIIRIGLSGFSEDQEQELSVRNFLYEVGVDQIGVASNLGSVSVVGDPRVKSALNVEWTRELAGSGNEVTLGGIKVVPVGRPPIGSPFGKWSTSQNNPSLEDSKQANSLVGLVGNVIANHISRLRFIHPVRGFLRAKYNLMENPVNEVSPRVDLDSQGAEIASTLEMWPGTQTLEKISQRIYNITGVRIDTDTEPNRQVGVGAIPSDLEDKIYIVNEGFATNQMIFLWFSIEKAPEHSLIGIEEPEIHLHPANQSKLAKLLIEVAQKEKKQLIMTTHSEHILFRLLSSVASGDLALKDLAINYFEKKEGETEVTPLEIDEKGRVKGGLPGFFETELDELSTYIEALSGKD